MSMLSKCVAIIAVPVGLMLSAASAQALTHTPTISRAPSSDKITFTLSRLGDLSGSFYALMALAALVVVAANFGLLWWQERRDGRKRGPD
jgi:hypothetical protein